MKSKIEKLLEKINEDKAYYDNVANAAFKIRVRENVLIYAAKSEALSECIKLINEYLRE